jgi:hypothetical protein
MIENSQQNTTRIRSGVIVCIAGDAPKDWSWEDEKSFRGNFSGFDAVKITTPEIMPYQLQHLWMTLLSAGIMHVVIQMAEFTDSGKLEVREDALPLPFLRPN